MMPLRTRRSSAPARYGPSEDAARSPPIAHR
jgi:hypothetical protein